VRIRAHESDETCLSLKQEGTGRTPEFIASESVTRAISDGSSSEGVMHDAEMWGAQNELRRLLQA